MRLFHSSTVREEFPDTQHSRPNLDFGCGFYLTAMQSQAENYAERFKRRGKPAVLNEYELDDDLSDLKLWGVCAMLSPIIRYVFLTMRSLNVICISSRPRRYNYGGE